MDPISSDREIGAFLNTFDKLAAMPRTDTGETRKKTSFPPAHAIRPTR